MKNDHVHDPDLLDLLEALPTEQTELELWRVFWAQNDVLTGGANGGRWNPSGFEALYTSLAEDAAIAEIYYHLSRAPVRSSSDKKISRLSVSCERIVRFETLEELAPLGVTASEFLRGDYRKGDLDRTQEIGAAARFLDIQGMIVPSARSMGLNFVLFPDRLEHRESLVILETFDVNWPAWREKVGEIPKRIR